MKTITKKNMNSTFTPCRNSTFTPCRTVREKITSITEAYQSGHVSVCCALEAILDLINNNDV